jgi:hypothetical protein
VLARIEFPDRQVAGQIPRVITIFRKNIVSKLLLNFLHQGPFLTTSIKTNACNHSSTPHSAGRQPKSFMKANFCHYSAASALGRFPLGFLGWMVAPFGSRRQGAASMEKEQTANRRRNFLTTKNAQNTKRKRL